MPHRPATLATDDVRIPSSEHRKGIKFLLDHVNEEFEIIDETEEHYPFIRVPATIAPATWYIKEQIGWKYVDDELWGYIGGNAQIKISTTNIRLYNASGTKTVHIDLTNGDIYSLGLFRGDGINMPSD